ncbi:MAG: hypothetical protein MRY63_11455 [Neomegalonema sp.]|nr:hypothetical protein [Neomegalonema sp.]
MDEFLANLHERLWAAIDALAQKKGLTASGLARSADLDATAFNRSKRQQQNGRLRWPSTETLGRVVKAADCTMLELAQLIDGREAVGAQAPILRFDPARGGLVETGQSVPDLSIPADCVLVEINNIPGGTFVAPGDFVVLHPQNAPQKGERMVLFTGEGRSFIGAISDLDEASVTVAGTHEIERTDIALSMRLVSVYLYPRG